MPDVIYLIYSELAVDLKIVRSLMIQRLSGFDTIDVMASGADFIRRKSGNV